MRPRIRQPVAGVTPDLRAVLNTARTAGQQEIVRMLLQRYGVTRPADLPPNQVTPFATELRAVLAGTAPHPADSVLDPTMVEVRK